MKLDLIIQGNKERIYADLVDVIQQEYPDYQNISINYTFDRTFSIITDDVFLENISIHGSTTVGRGLSRSIHLVATSKTGYNLSGTCEYEIAQGEGTVEASTIAEP